MLTRIPFFKDVVLAAFDCPHCGYRNNSVETAGRLEDKGTRWAVRIKSISDLNRYAQRREKKRARR